ncbi:MAG: hypothetical protein WBO24_17525 [Nitrospirales bacterium]
MSDQRPVDVLGNQFEVATHEIQVCVVDIDVKSIYFYVLRHRKPLR